MEKATKIYEVQKGTIGLCLNIDALLGKQNGRYEKINYLEQTDETNRV